VHSNRVVLISEKKQSETLPPGHKKLCGYPVEVRGSHGLDLGFFWIQIPAARTGSRVTYYGLVFQFNLLVFAK